MTDSIKEIHYAKYVKMESPYKADNRVVYHLFVDAKDLPAGLPTEVNPREVNKNKNVYKKIVSGLVNNEDSFFLNNRGILISAKGLSVDTLNSTIRLNIGDGSDIDNSLYGVLDGGHTYHAVINHRNEIVDGSNQFVHLEIMTDVRNIDELASARNTSVQVSDKAIAELADKFEFVKEAIKDTPFADKVSYRENEDKDLDSVDLVRLMFAFNISKFPDGSTTQPIAAYSGKAQVLKDYLQDYDKFENPYKLIAPLLPKITELYDHIEKEMMNAYLENNTKGRFGRTKGVESKESGITTKYYGFTTRYQISQGLLFPIVAAFRALITADKNGNYIWDDGIDPIEVWEKIKSKLVNNTIEMSRSLGNNPQSAGKNGSLWSQNYDAVNTEKLQIKIAAYSDQAK